MKSVLLTATLLAGFVPLGARGEPAPDASLIARGKYLVTAGDCVACHTKPGPGGIPFAGGQYISTPFGQMPTPNLTPDKETGLGSWTDDDFYRALHQGIRKDGAYLYPGLPYPWFTRVTRDDVLAIKAYLFSLPAVHAPTPPTRLVFPFTIRAGIAGWNSLYFKPGEFKPDASKSAQWNRGAYLVEGLGHCSDCHTPKNTAQAPIDSEAYSGGKLDGWYAPNITSDPKEGIGTWSQQALVTYLKTGAYKGRGTVIGPMAQTVHDSLSKLTDQDLTAMAVYIKALPAKQSYKQGVMVAGGNNAAGLQVYLDNCSSCHQPNGQGLTGAIPNLADNGAVTAKGPQNVLRAVLGGLPAENTYGPMPGFATVLSAQQIADVTNYVRTSWGNKAPATATPDMVSGLAPRTQTMLAGTHWCQAASGSPLDGIIANPSSGISAAMASITQDSLLERVDAIVADVKKAEPGAKQAEVVNTLTRAYCPYVAKDARVPVAQKGQVLDQFAALVYTQFSQRNTKLQKD